MAKLFYCEALKYIDEHMAQSKSYNALVLKVGATRGAQQIGLKD